MRIRSINVGKAQPIIWNGKTVETGIFKQSVSAPVRATALGLEGDHIANLEVHGGIDKAVYGFPADVYVHFQHAYPLLAWEDGFFGENLTIEELDEQHVWIGDTFRVGEVMLEVSECRMPCFKLGVKFDNQQIIREFTENGRSGVYFRVIREGWLEAGMGLVHLSRPEKSLTVSELFRLRSTEKNNVDLLKKAAQAEALPERLRIKFQETLMGI